jgi:hypothetical protein
LIVTVKFFRLLQKLKGLGRSFTARIRRERMARLDLPQHEAQQPANRGWGRIATLYPPGIFEDRRHISSPSRK